jgi:hypothetical protein
VMEKLWNAVYRLFFAVAIVLLIIAVVDWFLRLFGWTFSWLDYQPGRILQFSAILMVWVAALLLRQIRAQLRK